MSEKYNYTEEEKVIGKEIVKLISYNKKFSSTEYVGEFDGDVLPQDGDALLYHVTERRDKNNQLISRHVEVFTPDQSEDDYSAYDYQQEFKHGKLFSQSSGFYDERLRAFLQAKSQQLSQSRGNCYHGTQTPPRAEKGITNMSLKNVFYNESGLPCLISASGYGVGYKGFVSKNNIAIHYNSDNLIDAIVEYHFSDASLANLLPQSAEITVFKKPLSSLNDYATQGISVVERSIKLDLEGGLQSLQMDDKNGFDHNLDSFLLEHCPEIFSKVPSSTMN